MASNNLSFGIVDGRPLFLDLEADSYFLLDPDAEAEFFAKRDPGALQATTPAPSDSILDESVSRGTPRLVDLVAITRTILHARALVKRQPLAQLVASLTSQDLDDAARYEAGDLAARFARARAWIPIEPHCLHDSIALLHFLRRHGSGASLVFGAKRDPFAAHCWVQAGRSLLNDRIDRIASFTPVLVAGE